MGVHIRPQSLNMCRKKGGTDVGTRELAKVQGGGEEEFTLVEVPVGVVKMLPHQVFPYLGGGVKEASNPSKAEGFCKEVGV